jgi:hypothetical protein
MKSDLKRLFEYSRRAGSEWRGVRSERRRSPSLWSSLLLLATEEHGSEEREKEFPSPEALSHSSLLSTHSSI